MRNFKSLEFSEDIRYAHPNLLNNLDLLRDYLGCAIYPSPVQGALARFDIGQKNSQHYATNRLSTAVDIFIYCDPFEAYIKILKSNLFNRIGVYFDTFYKNRKWIMFHLDLKPQNLMWYRGEDGYHYSNSKDFYYNLFCGFNQII